MEEVPDIKTGRAIGASYLYNSEGEIAKDRSIDLTSALTGIGWNLLDKLQINPCPLGLSNSNYKIFCGDYGPLLLKVYGPIVGNTNLDEKHIQDCGFGAKVVLRLDWGRLETWLPGRAMRREDCEDSQVLAVLAKELRRLHMVTGRNHNDLNFTNVLVSYSADVATTHLLDFEYAGPLDAHFDVANFFCEWMYDHESSRWFEPDPTLFPSEEQSRSFIAQYLEITDSASSAVSEFLKEVQARIPHVHAYWIDWAMSNFSDRDEYVRYAELRQLLSN